MFWKRLVMYMIIVSMIFPPGMQIAIAQDTENLPSSPVPEGTVQYELFGGYLDRISRFMNEFGDTLDRSQFDLDSLLESLDYDAEEIIEFSKQSIAYEQYSGVLRGPLGTLFSRAGNAADQSLLLAKLLRDAGYEARIVNAKLSPADASVVLKAMKQSTSEPPPVGNATEMLEILSRYGVIDDAHVSDKTRSFVEYINGTPIAQTMPEYEMVQAASAFIAKSLRDGGEYPEYPEMQSNLIKEAQDYFWVQYKDAAADPWEDVHPVFHGDSLPFKTIEAMRFIAGEVPPELLHRVRFQVFIEKSVNGRLEETPLTAAWERPVANLVGVPLSFSNISDSMLSMDSLGTTLESRLETASNFVPVFGGGIAEGARFFDLLGNLVDPFAASNSASGLFSTVNRSFGKATGSVGSDKSVPVLTAQWLEFTLISPNGEEQTFRRTTFDRIGAAARESGVIPDDLGPTSLEHVRPLLQRHTFMIAANAIPRGFGYATATDYFERSRAGIEANIDLRYKKPPKKRSIDNVPLGWAGHLALYSVFDHANTLGPNHRNYRSGPALVIHSEGLADEEDILERIDIVSNPRRVLDLSGEIPAPDPEIMIQSGVWETAVEGALLVRSGKHNTWRAFAEASEAGIESVVLYPGRHNPAIDVSTDTYAAVSADLQRGYAVIIPRTELNPDRSGWWRIDMDTGETLGQFGDGRGVEITEFTVVSLVFSAGFFFYGAIQCNNSGGNYGGMDLSEFCCHAANTGLAVSTVVLGFYFALAKMAGVVAGAAVDGMLAVQPYTTQMCEELLEDDSIF